MSKLQSALGEAMELRSIVKASFMILTDLGMYKRAVAANFYLNISFIHDVFMLLFANLHKNSNYFLSQFQ